MNNEEQVRTLNNVNAMVQHIDSVVSHIKGAVSFFKWLLVILIILTLAGFLRSVVSQQLLERTEDAAQKATLAAETANATSGQSRDAALNVQESLDEILRELEAAENDQAPLDNAAVNEALLAVARIEGYLCGGKCPEGETNE